MSGIVIVGLSFGDEGKGRVVDYYAKDADMVVRYAGGCNAGHTLVVNGKKTILRQVPSGILNPNSICVMAQGMVIDPMVFASEIKALREAGIKLEDRLIVSDDAHVIMPYHIQVDVSHEDKLKNKIGTTKKGIGPCYEDKISRRGVRIKDLYSLNLDDVLYIRNRWMRAEDISESDDEMLTAEKELSEFLKMAVVIFAPFIANTSMLINNQLKTGRKVLFEGAQGTMLDIDHGTYPYVTSSSTISGGACTGSGVGPTNFDKVIGVTKAYTTRVGGGPFLTELNDEVAEHLRKVGNEFGSVTGRPRRVGWLNLEDLKYACMINGTTELAITKLDVLSGLPSISVKNSEGLKIFDGWNEDLSSVRKFSDLPKNAQKYIRYIESFVEVPACLISVGADRDHIIVMNDL